MLLESKQNKIKFYIYHKEKVDGIRGVLRKFFKIIKISSHVSQCLLMLISKQYVRKQFLNNKLTQERKTTFLRTKPQEDMCKDFLSISQNHDDHHKFVLPHPPNFVLFRVKPHVYYKIGRL